MALGGFNHTGFTVSDLDRSIEWWSEVLGAEPTQRRRSDDSYMGEMVGYSGCDMDYAYFPLPGSEAMIELIQYHAPASGQVDMETSNLGNGHICFLVDDIHAEFERLSAYASFRSPAPVEITAGANKGGWGAYMRDPDGITIQLLQPAPRSRPRGLDTKDGSL
jgi:catechol 2,3-dioxygenase-like lactoylglutathione lyase family enzyme